MNKDEDRSIALSRRETADSLRTRPVPLRVFIPLLQKAADQLEIRPAEIVIDPRVKLVDELMPAEHERTSCSDQNSNGNQFFNEMGFPRCVRCAFLHRLREGEWPHGARPDVSLRFIKEPK